MWVCIWECIYTQGLICSMVGCIVYIRLSVCTIFICNMIGPYEIQVYARAHVSVYERTCVLVYMYTNKCLRLNIYIYVQNYM